jgi:hypothetical protein
VKPQQVKYLHKATDTWHVTHIDGVRFENGPDKPYFTIKCRMHNVAVEESGIENISELNIEKQANPGRLIRMPLNADKSWKLIHCMGVTRLIER